MPSPPPSSEFEPSPQNEVSAIVNWARCFDRLTPHLATVMVTHKGPVLSIFERQIRLLQSRPQELALGHVTVYDKALLELTSNGRDLENPAALLFWCEAYLGIHRGNAATHTAQILQEVMAVPTLLDRCTGPPSPLLISFADPRKPSYEGLLRCPT
jgi:hypothetical protein